jgi:hypothetical protein
MSNPLQIQHIATRLIALHGPEARTYAANKADEMLAAGKLYERRTWRRVQEEVERALGRDLLGDFPGLMAALYADTAEPLSMLTPFPEEGTRVSDPASSDPHPTILALSTKWMSS